MLTLVGLEPNKNREVIEDFFSMADIQINGNRPWDIQVHHEKFYSEVLSKLSLGMGESYMEGYWDCPQLDTLFYKLLRAGGETKIKNWSIYLQVVKAKTLNLQDRNRSKQVAHVHYNLGNDLYQLMLDPYMQYTCAYYEKAETLNQAQENKLDLICRKLQLKPGEKVLELGCGWGGFAKYAAEKYGVEVEGYNISSEQVKWAREWTKNLPVKIHLSDYRDAKGVFDKVVSVGLCEHVGHKNYSSLMEIAAKCLKDEGLFLLHTIGSNTTKFTTDAWLDKYIFPGSSLPSIAQLIQPSEANFVMEDWHNFGIYYDKTLMHWFQNFENNVEQLDPLKYDQKFFRMWKYYLLCCAGSFRSRKNQLWQIVFSKGGLSNGYQSVR
jgi:cyclopropane-fatty-acyl-phospholipid synthase